MLLLEKPVRPTFAILLLVATVACSNPKNTKIPKDLSKIDTLKPALSKLTEEERALFGSYMMTHLMGTAPGSAGSSNPVPEGMTIGKCIQEQKAYVQEHGAEDAARKSRTGSPALKKK